MKEATGELNMTVITLVAIAAIGAVFYFVVWPLVQRTLVTQTCKTTYGPGWHAVEGDAIDTATTSQAKVKQWYCADAETSDCSDESEHCHVATEQN